MKKFSYLELLRLFTSLAVVIFHYHFFFQETAVEGSSFPFFSILELVYNYGRYGVDMFWAISGFVFAHVYLDQIKKTSSKEFFINRFARLYPLHLLTLIIVVGLQFISLKTNANIEIYKANDLYHFLLNLFYIHGWGIAKDFSFNGPTWSVSVELIVYGIFFISIIFLNKFRIKSVIIIYIFLLLVDKNLDNKTFYLESFFNCCRLFFSGILVHYIFIGIKNKFYLILISLCLMLISWLGSYNSFIFLPSIILFLSFFGTIINKKLASGVQFSGDLTYAIYLLHTPIQIIILLIINYFNIKNDIFLSEYFFLGYILFLIFISSISFKYFEKPLNYKLRKILKQ
jgi:peptidoglycan/LPS O-acetylase OafA/YrhL